MLTANPVCWNELRGEFAKASDCSRQLLQLPRNSDPNEVSSVFRDYTQLWQEIAAEAQGQGLDGLQDLCLLFQEASFELFSEGVNFHFDEAAQLLPSWHDGMGRYLDSEGSAEAAEALIRCLENPIWPNPLMKDDAEMLLDLLCPQSETETETDFDTESQTLSATPPGCPAKDLDTEAASPICTVTPELVAMIRDAFHDLAEELVEELVFFGEEEAVSQQQVSALKRHVEKLRTIENVAETVGLKGLQQVLNLFSSNLQAMCEDSSALVGGTAVLRAAPVLIQGYLTDIKDTAQSAALIEHLQFPLWIHPLAAEEAKGWQSLLEAVELTSDEENTDTQPMQALPEHVSLEVPDEVNQDLLDSLLQELPTLTGNFSSAIQRLIDGSNLQDVEEAQRIAHTLKGSSNMVGITGIATVTHHMEDILEALAHRGMLPPPALADSLMLAGDCLEAMSDALMGTGEAPEQAVDVLQGILHWAHRVKKGEFEAVEPEVSNTLAEPTPAPKDPQKRSAAPKSVSAASASTRVPSSLLNNMLRVSGETSILTGQIREQLGQAMEQGKLVREQNRRINELIAELENFINVQSFKAQLNRKQLNEEFDVLEMDQYNELHTVCHRIVEVATDSRELSLDVESRLTKLNDLMTDQHRLQQENQDFVMRTRMVPVQTIVPRCQRALRQACRMASKRVELEALGADTLIDSEILNDLIDPLIHLIRNAVDHGIETEQKRGIDGKDPTGHLTLEFTRQGSHIQVSCQDDGAGLDYDGIRKKAEKKGLISPDQVLTEDELARLILKSGFSTRSSTTQLSGRGIGMDAVQAHVLKKKGGLRIDSKAGDGCRITLTLPASLVSVRGLLVRSGTRVLALSHHGIVRILHVGEGELRRTADGLRYQSEGQSYAARELESLLHFYNEHPVSRRDRTPALLVQDESGDSEVILVEQIIDTRDLVVKNLGAYLPQIQGVVGATILGDGSVTPVLDLLELMRIDFQHIVASAEKMLEGIDADNRLPQALVVDDSLSARRALSEFLTDCGFEVRTAIDGIDAIEKIDEARPDIMLVDLEMPRMNGIELTTHVRSREAIQGVPVIMITSRSTEKHRRQAQEAGVNSYLTKPYAEDELLSQVDTCLAAQ